jgi:hypothetical protein
MGVVLANHVLWVLNLHGVRAIDVDAGVILPRSAV